MGPVEGLLFEICPVGLIPRDIKNQIEHAELKNSCGERPWRKKRPQKVPAARSGGDSTELFVREGYVAGAAFGVDEVGEGL